MKYDLETVKNIVENERKHLKLLSINEKKVYYPKTNKSRVWLLVKVYCQECDRDFEIYLDKLLKGSGCIKCAHKKNGDKQRFSYEKVKEIIEVTNAHLHLKLISKEYINSMTPILLKCVVCGYQFNGYLGNVRKGQGCFKCARKRVGENCRLKIEDVKKMIEKFNLKLLDDEYISHKQKLNVECEFGHKFKKNLIHLRRGQGCPICKSSTNKFGLTEEICRSYFEYLFDKKFSRCSPTWMVTNEGTNLILDGYNEELKVAFEYNGMQHYQYVPHFHKSIFQFNNQRLYDCLKIQLCYNHGIKLISIPYTVKPNQIYQYVLDSCNKMNINHQTKPFIKIEDLGIYNSLIKKKNEEIDKKLEGSDFKRMNNYSVSGETINIKCIKCNQFERNVLYSNFMKREIPKCDYCFHQDKRKELDDILIKFGYRSIGEYIHHRQPIKIECLECGNVVTRLPRDVMYTKYTGKCKECN